MRILYLFATAKR